MFWMFVRIASLMFYEEIRTKQDLFYISICVLSFLYNSKFILMAMSWGTNAVVVTRVHCNNKYITDNHLIQQFVFLSFYLIQCKHLACLVKISEDILKHIFLFSRKQSLTFHANYPLKRQFPHNVKAYFP